MDLYVLNARKIVLSALNILIVLHALDFIRLHILGQDNVVLLIIIAINAIFQVKNIVQTLTVNLGIIKQVITDARNAMPIALAALKVFQIAVLVLQIIRLQYLVLDNVV
jgi:hypothetical protein